MSAPKPTTTAQASLFDPGAKVRGPVRKALETDIRTIPARNLRGRKAIVELCRSLASTTDLAAARGDVFGVTAVSRELREAHAALNPPDSDTDALATLLADLGSTPMVHTSHP